MANQDIKAGDTVTCIDATNRQGITEGRAYKIERVSASFVNIVIINDHGNRVAYPQRRFKKSNLKSKKQTEYEIALALHLGSNGFYPMPTKPLKTPRSIKIDPQDAKAALSKMLKEVYGIDATVEQVIGAMDKSLELVLGA